jgi:hypothetical protein
MTASKLVGSPFALRQLQHSRPAPDDVGVAAFQIAVVPGSKIDVMDVKADGRP